MNFDRIEEKNEQLISEYLELFNEWNDINNIGLEEDILTEKLLNIKNQLDIIGAGMQLYEISEEIKRRKSGIILPN